jgi:hypothetical protein
MSVSRRAVAALSAIACLFAVGAVGGQSASADTDVNAPTPRTVSADALPTWQINGVVYSQVLVGNVVYATGRFTKARPPGVAQGGRGEIRADNIFAYDIRTGRRVAAFHHQMNGEGLTITGSPDGKRVYVGGNFTTVDGHAHSYIAAFSTKTKRLLANFRPRPDKEVRGIAVSSTKVYLGGNFLKLNGAARSRIGALRPGGRLSGWKASADSGVVRAMVISPDRSRLIVGGSFTKLNATAAYGMGALSTGNGRTLPWAANQTIRNAGANGAITSLRKDGSQIYGSGYAFGSGANFEGTFAANPDTGAINWVNDCHGDTYDVLPVKQVLYSVGHAHDCSVIGEFPNTSPVSYHRALASWTTPHGTNGADSRGGAWLNYNGKPAAQHLHWFPALSEGTFTGQNQAAWSLAGNTRYIALGGEFPKVNGVPQEGLVRYALRSIAPNKRGSSRDFAPSAAQQALGTARVSWTAVWDPDNRHLTYTVQRKQGANWVTINQQGADSNFWQRPSLHYDDSGLSSGQYRYRVLSHDVFGNTRVSDTVTVQVTGVG